MRKYFSEFLGTFTLVFCGTGAIIIDEQSGGLIGHVGIAITVGLVILSMIYTFGETSGAHFNPAVTIGFAISNRFPFQQILPYILSQIAGAFFATIILKFLFPENINLGSTNPAGSQIQSFILELILTFLLMTVILNVSHGSKETGIIPGIAIGATICFEAMFGGPVSGASMNPARSLSPAVISGNMNSLWIYLLAPTFGAILASLIWKLFDNKSQMGFISSRK